MKKITFLFLVLAFGVFSIGWAQTTTFNFTGGVQTYTVPSGIFEVQIEALGGAGQVMTLEQYDPSIGGLGGRATGALAVTPGQVLNIFVGGAGIDGAGGYNGGGVGGFGTRSSAPMSGFAGSGGGASDVRVGGVTLADRVIVAGGGGGGGRDYVNGSCQPCGTGGNGGAGGALVGTNGIDAGPGNSSAGLYPHPDSGGSGGDQVMGGAGGMGTGPNGNPGILGVGGDGIDGTQSTASAGGGGGYYGGGAGSGSVGGSGTAGGGGAGGSSYLGGVTSGMTTGGVHSGDGQILITISNSAPIAVCQDYTAQLDVNGSVTINGANVDGGSSDPDGDMFTLSVSPNTFDCSDIENIALDLTGGTSVGISTNANATIPTGNQARTLSVRINPATFSNSVGGIMHQGNLDCTGRMFGTGMNNSGFLFFWGGCNDYLSNLQLDLNVWQTVTVVYDGAGTVTLYKNGTSENYASGTLFTQLSRLFVGVETINNGASYRNFVDAQYSDIKVFDRALTPVEVSILVAGNDVALGNLVLDIPVDEGTGMALSDNAGTNDATAFGTTESDWIVTNNPQTVTLTVTDVNGNSSTCTAEVTIEDSIAPVITCVGDAPRDTDPGVCDYTVVGTEFDATFTDNCMNMSATITNDVNGTASLAGEVLPLGDTVVTWTADDGNGQMATCTTTVTVEDNELPAANCVATIAIQLDSDGNATIAAQAIPVTSVIGSLDATDPQFARPIGSGTTCNTTTGSNHFYDVFAFTIDAVDVYTFDMTQNTNGDFYFLLYEGGFDPAMPCVNWIAGDDDTNGNDPQVSLQLNLVPGNYELVTTEFFGGNSVGAYDYSISSAAGGNVFEAGAAVDGLIIDNGSSDNCGIDTIVASQVDFTCADVGDNTVTLTITDVNGNVSMCSTVVTVEDTTPVMITSGPVDIFTGTGPSAGNCETVVNYDPVTAGSFVIDDDNCFDTSTVTVAQTGGLGAGASFPVGTTVEEYTLTDASGNETVYTFEVTITDTTLPVIDCPGDLIVSDGGTGLYTIEDYTTSVTDNCSAGADLVVTQDPAAGTEVANGSTTTVTVTATDAA